MKAASHEDLLKCDDINVRMVFIEPTRNTASPLSLSIKCDEEIPLKHIVCCHSQFIGCSQLMGRSLLGNAFDFGSSFAAFRVTQFIVKPIQVFTVFRRSVTTVPTCKYNILDKYGVRPWSYDFRFLIT